MSRKEERAAWISQAKSENRGKGGGGAGGAPRMTRAVDHGKSEFREAPEFKSNNLSMIPARPPSNQ